MNDVIRTRAMFCDLLNLPRGKIVPTKQAKSGSLGFARGVFGLTYDRDLISVPSCGLYHGIPDMELALEKKRRPGWQARTDIALGDLHTYGAPFALCPRSALKRAVSGRSLCVSTRC